MEPGEKPIDKQKDNNSTRGFASHPENINRKGRPLKGRALTDMTRKLLLEINPETGKTHQQEFVETAVALARGGDVTMLKFLWEQMDGKAVQTIIANLSRGLEDVTDDELDRALHDTGD